MDLAGVVQAVAAGLEGARVSESRGSGSDMWVTGKVRGHEVSVKCSHHATGSGSSSWYARVDVDNAPPLALRLERRDRGMEAVIERGAMEPIATGDGSFDAAWIVEGAPRETVRRVVDEAVRAAIVRLAEVSDAGLTVERGKILVQSGTRFEADEVLRGVDLAVAVGESLATVVVERRRSPPEPGALAVEQKAVAALREREKSTWARSSWPMRVAMVVGVALAAAWAIAVLVGSCLPS